MNNQEKSEKIRRLLGLRKEDTDTEYYGVAYVLCDLQHFCDHNDIDFDDEFKVGRLVYDFERSVTQPSEPHHLHCGTDDCCGKC